MTETRLLKTSNGTFHVAVDGSPNNPVVLFSNSLGTILDMWNDQVEYLANDFYIIRYDTRGHGRSDVPSGPYSMADLGSDVIAIMDALDIPTASLCGLSIGGLTVQWLGIHAADRFDRIIISNSAARLGIPSAWHDRARDVREHGMDGVAKGTAERWFTPTFERTHPSLIKKAVGWVANTPAEGYAGCCEALATTDLRDQIADITLPVLIIAGSQDPVTTVVDAEFIQQKIPSSTVVSVDASHLSNLEATDQFNQAIKPFLLST